MKAKRVDNFIRGGDPYKKLKLGGHRDKHNLPPGTSLICVEAGAINILEGIAHSAEARKGDVFVITKKWNDYWYVGYLVFKGRWDQEGEGEDLVFGVSMDYISPDNSPSDFFAQFKIESAGSPSDRR